MEYTEKAVLERRITQLEDKLKAEFLESGERGKELEKLRGMIVGYKDLLPEAVFDNLMVPVTSYEKRCTKMGKCQKKKMESP